MGNVGSRSFPGCPWNACRARPSTATRAPSSSRTSPSAIPAPGRRCSNPCRSASHPGEAVSSSHGVAKPRETGPVSRSIGICGCPSHLSRLRQKPWKFACPSIYSIVPPNDGSALRHGHHFEPVDFVIDHGRGHHDAYSAGSCQRTYARACGCRQRTRCHREELIESERGWSGREAFVTMMQTADLGQGNDRSRPGRLNGSSIRCVLAERQVGP